MTSWIAVQEHPTRRGALKIPVGFEPPGQGKGHGSEIPYISGGW